MDDAANATFEKLDVEGDEQSQRAFESFQVRNDLSDVDRGKLLDGFELDVARMRSARLNPVARASQRAREPAIRYQCAFQIPLAKLGVLCGLAVFSNAAARLMPSVPRQRAAVARVRWPPTEIS